MIEARRHFRSWFLATAAVALLPVLGTGPVQAQYSDSVTVDLSVIGGGYDPGPGMSSGPVVTPYATTPVYGGGTLRMPGSAAPPSRFFPPSGLGMPAAPSGDSVSVPAYAPPKAAAKKKAPPREETAAAPPPAPKKERAEPTAPPARLAKQQQPATAAPAAPALPAAAPEPPPAPKVAAVAPKAKVEPSPAPAPAPKAASAPPPAPTLKKVEPPPAMETAKAEPAKMAPPARPAGEGEGVAAIKVVFSGDAAAIPAGSRDSLKALAAKVNANDEQRLQLVAYASGAGVSPSSARRLSLSRALAVRSVLIDAGVRSSRIDVRALGDKPAGEPANRVDVNLVDR